MCKIVVVWNVWKIFALASVASFLFAKWHSNNGNPQRRRWSSLKSIPTIKEPLHYAAMRTDLEETRRPNRNVNGELFWWFSSGFVVTEHVTARWRNVNTDLGTRRHTYILKVGFSSVLWWPKSYGSAGDSLILSPRTENSEKLGNGTS